MQNPFQVAVAGLSIGYVLIKGQGQNSGSTGYPGYSSQSSQSGLGQVKDKVGDVVVRLVIKWATLQAEPEM